MNQPLISFIIADYNLPCEMLCECIDSILALPLSSLEREIIVVDDGSETNALNGLAKYGEELIYIRQAHQGLSAARNTGIQMSRGKYLQFVDGDDRLICSPYGHCIDIIKSGKYDMVVFDFTKSALEDKAFTDRHHQSGSDYMRLYNIRGTAWGYIFKKSCLGNLRFTTGIYHEDEEFTPLLLLRTEKTCVTDAKAYFYRQRQNSIITDTYIRKRIKRLNDLKSVIIRLNIIADKLPANDKTALQRRVAQLTMDYIYQMILLTRSRNYLNKRIEELRELGLFPLPDKGYTTKYKWFCRLSKSRAGLNILMQTIPLLKKER